MPAVIIDAYYWYLVTLELALNASRSIHTITYSLDIEAFKFYYEDSLSKRQINFRRKDQNFK